MSGPFKETLGSGEGRGSWISEEDVARATDVQTHGQRLVLAANTKKIPQTQSSDLAKDEVGAI